MSTLADICQQDSLMFVQTAHGMQELVICSECAAGLVTNAADEARELCAWINECT